MKIKKSELKKQAQEYIKIWNYCSPPLSFVPISNEVMNYLINKCGLHKVKDINEYKKKLAILLGSAIVKQEQWKVTISWFLQNYVLIETKYGYFDDIDIIRERIIVNLSEYLGDDDIRKILNIVCGEVNLEIAVVDDKKNKKKKEEDNNQQIKKKKGKIKVDDKIFDTILEAIYKEMNEENKLATEQILKIPENGELIKKNKNIFNSKLSLFKDEQIRIRYVLDILYLLNIIYQMKNGDAKIYSEYIKKRAMQMIEKAIHNIDLSNLSFYNNVNIFQFNTLPINRTKLSVSDRFLIRDLF